MVFILHVGTTAYKEKAKKLNSQTVKSDSGLYLTLVEPTPVKYRQGLINRLTINRPRVESWYLHYEGENVLRSLTGQVADESEIKEFIVVNGLYHDLEEIRELNEAEVEVKIKDETLRVSKSELLSYKDRTILPYIVREADYIRYETKLFEESRFFNQLVRAMSRDTSMMRDYKQLVIISFIAIVITVFFAFGGVNLIKFW